MKDRSTYLLDKFVSETLSEEEKAEFQECMRKDEGFRRKMIKTLEIDSHLDDWLKSGAPESHPTTAIPIYKKQAFYIPTLAIAAALVIGLIILSLVRPANYERLFKSEYQAFVLDDYRSQGSSDQNNMIISYYLNGNYTAVYELVRREGGILDLDDQAALLAGVASIEVKDYEMARILLESVSDESGYRYDVDWYLGLLYLKNKEIERSLQYLERAEKSQVYAKDVRKLKARIIKSGEI